MKITKSCGQTPTEHYLAQLCENTFLKIWSYPNPYKSDGKELCDLIVIFENHVFVFFDRESKKFDNSAKEIELTWQRWEKKVIDKQASTALGAERYLISVKGDIYLDDKCQNKIPIELPKNGVIVHKIIVAHGAESACKLHSANNVYGSLGMIYSDSNNLDQMVMPFVVNQRIQDKIHILDSCNLQLILNELDTVSDFTDYIIEKERVFQNMKFMTYSGEEDLLAQYLINFDDKTNKHYIIENDEIDGLIIPEGTWQTYIKSESYKAKIEANKISHLWDSLIQHVGEHALNGRLTGNANIFSTKSPIHEMAKEPRTMRRTISNRLYHAFNKFPDNIPESGLMRQITFVGSIDQTKAYLILQVAIAETISNYEEYTNRRKMLLEIACGAAKNKFNALELIIGIAMDSPKHYKECSEDFMLFECSEWDEDIKNKYLKLNTYFNFFAETTKINHETIFEYPV